MKTRAAIIDMGSNAIRLYIGELDEDNTLNEIVYKRASIKLANDSFVSGKVSLKSITNVKKVFKEFRDIALAHDCDQIKAVATSALRDAENANELIREVFLETSIMIELITGEFEAELVAKSVLTKLDMDSFILADLGGGSLEIVLIKNKEIVNTRSFQIGNLRFAQQLENCATNDEKIKKLGKLFEPFRALIDFFVEDYRGTKLVITGGNSNFVAKQIANDENLNEAYSFDYEMIKSFFEQIQNIDSKELSEHIVIRKDREQTLLPSLYIFSELSKLIETNEIIVPFTGLREGLVFHLLELAQQ